MAGERKLYHLKVEGPIINEKLYFYRCRQKEVCIKGGPECLDCPYNVAEETLQLWDPKAIQKSGEVDGCSLKDFCSNSIFSCEQSTLLKFIQLHESLDATWLLGHILELILFQDTLGFSAYTEAKEWEETSKKLWPRVQETMAITKIKHHIGTVLAHEERSENLIQNLVQPMRCLKGLAHCEILTLHGLSARGKKEMGDHMRKVSSDYKEDMKDLIAKDFAMDLTAFAKELNEKVRKDVCWEK